MSTVTLELNLPQEIYLSLQSAGLSRKDLEARATRDLALQLYSEGRISLGKAAKLTGVSITHFWMILIERDLPVFEYTADDYEVDQRALENWHPDEAKE